MELHLVGDPAPADRHRGRAGVVRSRRVVGGSLRGVDPGRGRTKKRSSQRRYDQSPVAQVLPYRDDIRDSSDPALCSR